MVSTDINKASLISIKQLGSDVKLSLNIHIDQNLGLLDLNNRITHQIHSILKS